MSSRLFGRIISVMLFVLILTSACAMAQAPTATPTPAATATATLPPTKTPRPTITPYPTRTPNATATAEQVDFLSQVQAYYDKGYITVNTGNPIVMDNFTQEWAQINWYQWWPMGRTATDFVLNAHFRWMAASNAAEESGCGFVFALQGNGDNYAVYLANTRILFLQSKLAHGVRAGWELGKTSGSGRVNITDNPADADFSLVVSKAMAYVYVNKQSVGTYTLSQDSDMDGELAYSLYSGTNKGYGTHCDMTNVRLMIID